MNIMANNLKRMYDQHADEFEAKALEVLRSGWYILGNELRSFENEFAQYIGSKYCVGLASGLDALWIAFRRLSVTASRSPASSRTARQLSDVFCRISCRQSSGAPPQRAACAQNSSRRQSATREWVFIMPPASLTSLPM